MARQAWQGFLDCHQVIWRFVEIYDRSFWADLADVSQEIRQATYPGGRARVRKIRTRDAHIQARADAVERSTQTELPREE